MVHRWHSQAVDLPRVLSEDGVRLHAFAKHRQARTSRIEPTGNGATIILGVGSTWTLAAAGVASRPHRVDNSDSGCCLELSLPPWFAAEVFPKDLISTVTNAGLVDALGTRGKALVEEVSNSADVEAAANTLIRFLCDPLVNKRRKTRPEIRWAWRRLTLDCGERSIKALAGDVGWSERHFTAKYSEAIGCSPMRTARLARFSAAYRAVAENRLSLAEVSTTAGYYDQSHMIRDFHEFAGMTPGDARLQEAEHTVAGD